MASPLSLLATTYQSWPSMPSLLICQALACSRKPFHKQWVYFLQVPELCISELHWLTMNIEQVKQTAVQPGERKIKPLSLSMFVKKQEIKHGLTQAKLCTPYISYSHCWLLTRLLLGLRAPTLCWGIAGKQLISGQPVPVPIDYLTLTDVAFASCHVYTRSTSDTWAMWMWECCENVLERNYGHILVCMCSLCICRPHGEPVLY